MLELLSSRESTRVALTVSSLNQDRLERELMTLEEAGAGAATEHVLVKSAENARQLASLFKSEPHADAEKPFIFEEVGRGCG